MKLGIISSMAASPWGGSEELWVALASQALSEGHTVAASVYNWGELPVKIKEIEKKGVVIHKRSRISYLDIKGKFKGKIAQLFVAEKQLLRFTSIEKPEVLFISFGAFCDFEIDALRNFLLSTSIPFHIVIHSNTDTYAVDYSKIEQIRNVCIKAKNIFFVSKRIKEQSERQIGYAFMNSQIIINPINMKEIGILPYSEVLPVEMACVGAIQVGVKGQAMLLQILSAEKWKNRNWVLNIYGHGVDEKLVHELINFYGLESKVFMKGYVSNIREEIWASNHILLMPSFIEGMPISLIEAMLCGRTAVVTDVGGNKEVLENEISGFIAEGATSFSYEKALEQAWTKISVWKSMGEVAYENAVKYYDKDSLTKTIRFLNETR